MKILHIDYRDARNEYGKRLTDVLAPHSAWPPVVINRATPINALRKLGGADVFFRPTYFDVLVLELRVQSSATPYADNGEAALAETFGEKGIPVVIICNKDQHDIAEDLMFPVRRPKILVRPQLVLSKPQIEQSDDVADIRKLIGDWNAEFTSRSAEIYQMPKRRKSSTTVGFSASILRLNVRAPS